MKTHLLTKSRRFASILGCAACAGLKIGCVPTMGALHAGHGSLIEHARADSDVVVVTIFVNPIQFDRKDDYERYAKNLESDLTFCELRNVDAVFAPSVKEMYPEPIATFVDSPDCPGIFAALRGRATFEESRPWWPSFSILFNRTSAYFGEKDAQQLALIQQMTRDLNFPIRIVAVPTVRESDGLALSSRNQRLTPEERVIAPAIYQALTEGRQMIEDGQRQALHR